MTMLTKDLLKEKDIIEKAGRLHWIHWLVVILSLILTFSAWYISKTTIEEKTRLQFNRQAEQVVEMIKERMQKYEDALWGGVSAIQMKSDDITYTDWAVFANNLNIDIKYPGINGIGVIYYIKPEERENYLSKQRLDRPDFKIHPEHNNNEFWPITYIEPVENNRQAVGLDISHETNRYNAGIKARDKAEAKITGPITLVQDNDKTPGFLFYAPFYIDGKNETLKERRDNFIGMVYAPFVVKKLMEGTLQKEKRYVGVKIIDDNEVLYNEHIEDNEDFDVNPLYSKKLELNLYGRSWVFDIWSKHSFRENTHSNQPMMILVGGIIIDTLLLTLFILLANSNQRAISFIKKLTSNGE